MLSQAIEFAPDRDAELFAEAPAGSAIFVLRGAAEGSEPYIGKTANLRRRLQRLLGASEGRKLNLRDRVRSVVTMLLVSLVVEKPRMVLAVPVCRMMSEMDGSK